MKLLGHLGAIITVSCWGASFISTKVLMVDGGFTPVEVFSYRFTLAYILLLLLTCNKSLFSRNWRDEVTFMICGLCSCTIYFLAENFALKHTTTTNVSLLSAISPIFTALLMAIFYKMKLSGGLILGTVVAFIGVGCVVLSGGGGLEFRPLGDLLALSSAMSWAVYSIVVRRVQPHYNTFFITRKIFFYGVLASLPILLSQTEPYHYRELFDMQTPQYLLNLLFLVLFCSAAAYLMWNEANRILGSVTANNYLYGQPIVTMIIGVMALGEPVTVLGVTGCALIIGGLVAADKLDFTRIKRRA